jgi:hypothetical protein
MPACCQLSEPLLAGTFLREHLPPDLVELLTLESPELLPGSFVDEALGSIWHKFRMTRFQRTCACGLI